MKQSYKIYLNQSIVILAQTETVFHMPKTMKNTSIVVCNSKGNIKDLIEKIQECEIEHNVILINDDLKWLKETFFDCFKIIEAGGGLVKNQQKEILMIFRKGKWDLAKGKIEKDEKTKAGAIREVEEETGVKVHKVKKKLGKTYHTYKLKGNLILKETHWYAMYSKDTNTPIPQAEEGIEEVTWATKKEVKGKLKNSFASIQDVFEM